MAVAETGMGVVEDKVIKNHYASEYIYNKYKDTQTLSLIHISVPIVFMTAGITFRK